MKAWALAAAAAVLLLAGVAHAQDGPCLQTVVGCTTCDDADPSKVGPRAGVQEHWNERDRQSGTWPHASSPRTPCAAPPRAVQPVQRRAGLHPGGRL